MAQNHITIDGNDARDTYLIEALKLVQNYGVVRAHTLAFGLFPNRTRPAATAAAHRVLANGVKEGFFRSKDDLKTRRRYYALTLKGARHLSSEAPEYAAQSTQAVLNQMSRSHHRDWAMLIAMSSNARADMFGVTEDQLWSKLRAETLGYFGHVPDSLTFFTNGTGKKIAIWHEVEASRRSRTASAADKVRAKVDGGTARSGMDHFRHLLQQLRLRRFITHNNHEYTVALVLHCLTEKIERELRKAIEDTFQMFGIRRDDGDYSVPFASAKFGNFVIMVNRLPARPEQVWLDTPGFPWPGAPGELKIQRTHHFLARK